MSFGFGKDFRITVFGESHGNGIGVVAEGVPAGFPINSNEIQQALDRRRPGGNLSSARKEPDRIQLLSGITEGKANGGPITMMVENRDVDSSWYRKNEHIPRPGHSDYAAYIKYGGFNEWLGGGFFSGRMTAAFVMGGAVAQMILRAKGVRVLAHLIQLGSVKSNAEISDSWIEENAPKSPVWCADSGESLKMVEELERVMAEKDSLGGTVECRAIGLPAGIGEPLFDSIESVLSHGVFSIPAVKGIEFGDGFRLCGMKGSDANDGFVLKEGKVTFLTNHAGGVLGGITDGMPLIMRVAFKPTPSIGKEQHSIDLEKMEETAISVEGRHDPCIAIRAVPVVESVVAICLADLMIRAQKIGRVEVK
ncbi:MAG: chorismate synthase [Candidatus Methanomethylicus sp.]|nr:chorismate synthase [Candidatus Methanomethylicus sp.]